MKNQTIKIIAFLVLICAGIFFLEGKVLATSGDSSSEGQTGMHCTPEMCWPSVPSGSGTSARAMRMSLIDVHGNYYGGSSSINIIDNATRLNGVQSYNYSYWTTNCNKVSYLKGKCNYGDPTSGKVTFADIGTVDSIFKSVGVDNFSSSLSNFNISKIVGDLEGATDVMGGLTFIKEMFKLSQSDITYLIENPEKLKELWIVFEPATLYRLERNYYFGTAYELANFSVNGNKYTGSLMNNQMPCASYVTGEIPGKATLIGYSVPGASDTSYFNGTINYESGCGFIHPDVTASNSGYGIGLIWMPLIYDGAEFHSDLAYTCDGVESYYNEKRLAYLTLEQIRTFDFSDYNQSYDVNITNQWYEDNCFERNNNCDPNDPTCDETNPNKFNCTAAYNVGTCADGETISYKDSSDGIVDEAYWQNCVFNDNGKYDIDNHKTSEGATYSYKDENLSKASMYCDVYCVEELTTNLTSTVQTVKAGNHFQIQTSTITGSRTCRTETIEWDAFNSDMNAANAAIKKAYEELRVEQNKQAAIDAAEDAGTLSYEKDVCKICGEGTITSKSVCTLYNGTWEDGMCKKGPDGEEQFASACTIGDGCKETGKETWYRGLSWSGYGSVEGGSTGDSTEEPTANVVGKETNYNTKVGEAYTNITAINNCSSGWSKDSIYKIDPDVTLEYSDGYNYEISLDLTPENDDNNTTTTTTSPSFSSDCVNTTVGVYNVNSNGELYYSQETVRKCSYFQGTVSGYTELKLPDEYYRYVLKDTSLSIHGKELEEMLKTPTSTGLTINYIDIGYSNLPVSFQAQNGVYGGDSKGQYDYIYSNLGHIGDGPSSVDYFLEEVDSENYGTWSCQFRVTNEIIECPPGDQTCSGETICPVGDPDCYECEFLCGDDYVCLENCTNCVEKCGSDTTCIAKCTNMTTIPDTDGGGGSGEGWLIYRPIDLYDPFPDLNANGRSTGYNWCFEGNCANDEKNPVVDYAILNNRGVVGDDLYYGENAEPMYTFELTPDIINQIRAYNDINDYGSYVGKDSKGHYYDFRCNTGTGEACISEYLTHLIDITGALNEPGTCVDPNTRNENKPSVFEGCRYPDGVKPEMEVN